MNCKFHPEVESVTKCAICGAEMCSQCDTNAFYRDEKGPLCLECSLLRANEIGESDETFLKRMKRKVISASIFVVLAVIFLIAASNDHNGGMAFCGIISWFIAGFIQTRGHEKDQYSVKSIIWGDSDSQEDGFLKTVIKLVFYLIAAPVMLLKNFKKLSEAKKDLAFDVKRFEEIEHALSKSYEEQFEYWKKEAETGSPVAQVFLGDCYFNGKGVAQDKAKGVELYTKSADQGNEFGEYVLAECYSSGDGVEKNLEKAVELWTKSANKNALVSQFALGLCYYNGEGVTKDYAKAVEWWTKAAAQNHSFSQYRLGVCYEEGTGVEHDHAKAVELITMAAEQGHKDALEYLKKFE